MADITMCKGNECPFNLRANCYRFSTNEDKDLQSWFVEAPVKAGKCQYQLTLLEQRMKP